MSRKRFTYRDILRIVDRQLVDSAQNAYVVCPICKQPIWNEEIDEAELDHGDAVGFGEGRDVSENCAFVHGDCHKRKTAEDKARIAKAKRQAGETGQKARRDRRNQSSIPSRSFPANRNGQYKQKFNGTIEQR